ncbi:glutathione S-transferase [Roseivivax halodurans JCM 10272]|uniref:Glutathione S-transferase n=1 Tax=Roseivivax halodurans JCM 10272 TaxID=1449350 RepID=X7EJA6_9RHOB|nr:glutathione S-transferase [Roseivivax halodurans]ETX15238.1 glutathione S-transferase [Roseivivax halodurans JCM 10272]
MLTLYSSDASPFARMVRVCLHETGLGAKTEIRNVKSTPMEPDTGLAAANPIGKLPALARDEGPAIYDSRVICRYLDARCGAGLYPESRLWEVLTLEALAHGIAEAALAMTYEVRLRPEDKVHEPWREAQWAKIARALDALEERWTSLLKGRVTMAQVALGCALGYLDLRLADRDWRAGHPQLAEWQSAFAQRPSMTETAPA